MNAKPPVAFPPDIRISALPAGKPLDITARPDAQTCATVADDLGIRGLKKLNFSATLSPQGQRDWLLRGTLGATVVQDCVITLAPVSTRIDVPVLRSYLADLPEPGEPGESEMPEDDSVEPLPALLDIKALIYEVLALNLPAYPRAPEAELGRHSVAPPGVEPLRDEDLNPFAALSRLKPDTTQD